jgi:hypothetical protein
MRRKQRRIYTLVMSFKRLGAKTNRLVVNRQ